MKKDNSTKVKQIERASYFQLDVKLHRATGDADEEEQRQLVGTSITKVGSDKKKYQKILRSSIFKLI